MLDPNPNLDSLVATAREGLKEHLGATSSMVAAAPGRVNLIGEHIDYCDGFVLPFAIQRYIVIAAAPNDTKQARVATSFDTSPAVIDLDAEQQISDAEVVELPPRRDPRLPQARHPDPRIRRLHRLQRARRRRPLLLRRPRVRHRHPARGPRRHPPRHQGTGAALPEGRTRLRQRPLRHHGPVRLRLRRRKPPRPHRLPAPANRNSSPSRTPALTVLIANTKVHHELSDGGYAARRKNTEDGLAILGKKSWRDVDMAEVDAAWDKLGDPVNRRARHVVGEIERTIAAAEALRHDDFESLGPLMAASHDSLRDDFEVSCRELDLMVEIAREIGRDGGVIGARMTGGGFGGSTVTLCESDPRRGDRRHPRRKIPGRNRHQTRDLRLPPRPRRPPALIANAAPAANRASRRNLPLGHQGGGHQPVACSRLAHSRPREASNPLCFTPPLARLSQPPPFVTKTSPPTPAKRPRILVVTPEITYLPEGMGNLSQRMSAKAGGMADVSASLVRALYEQGADVHVALPNYRRMFDFDVANVFELEFEKVSRALPMQRIHLAEDRVFYHRSTVYGGENHLIALAFQREVINHTIPQVRPDLIHCNDWMTGLIPAVARRHGIPSLFTVHNIHTERLTLADIEDRGIDAADFWQHLYYSRPPAQLRGNP